MDQFAHQLVIWYLIEGFTDVQNRYVDLRALVPNGKYVTITKCSLQLGLTGKLNWPYIHACCNGQVMLCLSRYWPCIAAGYNSAFHSFADDIGEADWPVILMR